MIRKNLDQCYIIEKTVISKSTILNLFLEYGNYITICVIDTGKFLGVITYGQWYREILNEENWINSRCELLVEECNEKLYEKAQYIFGRNKNIRTIPVVDEQRNAVGVIDKYESNDEMEKEILGDLWAQICEFISDDTMQFEIQCLKEVVRRGNFFLNGRNYLSVQLERFLGLKTEKQGSLDNIMQRNAYCIIDMKQVLHDKVRNHFPQERLDGISMPISTFLEQLVFMMANENFTVWNACCNSKYCYFEEYLRLIKADNIVIPVNGILSQEYCSFFDKAGFTYKLSKEENRIVMDINYAGKKLKRNFYYFENGQSFAYVEEQIIRMNIKFKKNRDKHLEILNVVMPLEVPFNKHEQLRVEKGFSFPDFEDKEWIDFWKCSSDGHRGFNGRRDWHKAERLEHRWIKGRGIVIPDFVSDTRNRVNSIRLTTDVPDTYINTIYIVGLCIAGGACVIDRDSIASMLQRKINIGNKKYRVISIGGGPASRMRRRFQDLNLEEGDIIINIYISSYKYLSGDIVVIDLNKIFQNIDSNHPDMFWDCVLHCNARANRIITNHIWPYVRERLRNFDQNSSREKRHNLYTVFNHDIEWAEEYIIAYLEYLSKTYLSTLNVLDTPNYNGAIVMNANPFTYGHQYLIENAAKEVDYLYVFVVEEDLSEFKFNDRFEMVKAGTAYIHNVIVVPSGKPVLSERTFPGYFQKQEINSIQEISKRQEILVSVKTDALNDIQIFAKYIAPALQIKKRFAGKEPLDALTQSYNHIMRSVLPEYGIEFSETERYEIRKGDPISASFVRKLLKINNIKEVLKYVPNSTFSYINEHKLY